MKPIKQTYLMNATPAEVWRALTDPEVIAEWSGADAEFEPTVGADYALWDGSICGEILEVVPNKKLVQTWFPDIWMREDSVVTFTLTKVGDQTRVNLLHENVEESDYEGTDEGWDVYYLGAIKRLFDAKKPRNARPRIAKTTKGTKTAKGQLAVKKKVVAKKSVKKK